MDAGAEFSIGSLLFGGSVLSGWGLLCAVAGGTAVSVGTTQVEMADAVVVGGISVAGVTPSPPHAEMTTNTATAPKAEIANRPSMAIASFPVPD